MAGGVVSCSIRLNSQLVWLPLASVTVRVMVWVVLSPFRTVPGGGDWVRVSPSVAESQLSATAARLR